MKYIKSYQIFESTNLELEKELEKFNITEYILNEDGSIDINDEVDLLNLNLNKIPFKFNKVNGNFFISQNNLTSLHNCPNYISGDLFSNGNKLTSLEYGPEYVGSDYFCDDNKLVTLKGCVEEVYGHFDCRSNELTSLEFCPMDVKGWFDCSFNNLEYLDRSPLIGGDFYCYGGMFKSKPEFNGSCRKLVWEFNEQIDTN